MSEERRAKSRKRAGRPKGSLNLDRDQVATELIRCRRCGSTDRGPYSQKIEQAHGGTTPGTGEPFTHIVRRWTRCSNCGQARIERTYENRRQNDE